MTRILWVSRNKPLSSQVEFLKKIFGEDVYIHLDGKPFSSASDIIKRFKDGRYDEMVLIAPLTVCRIMTEMGYRPLYSEMAQVNSRDSELEVQGTRERLKNIKRYYKFIRFRRLMGIKMEFIDF